MSFWNTKISLLLLLFLLPFRTASCSFCISPLNLTNLKCGNSHTSLALGRRSDSISNPIQHPSSSLTSSPTTYQSLVHSDSTSPYSSPAPVRITTGSVLSMKSTTEIKNLKFTYLEIDGLLPPEALLLIEDFNLLLYPGNRRILVESNGAGEFWFWISVNGEHRIWIWW